MNGIILLNQRSRRSEKAGSPALESVIAGRLILKVAAVRQFLL